MNERITPHKNERKAMAKMSGTTGKLRNPLTESTNSAKVMASELSHRRGDGFLYRGGAEEYESADDGPHEHGARFAKRFFLPLCRHEFEADEDEHNHDDDATDDFHETEHVDDKSFK